ncbi:MAG: thioredoxin domain-containing protein [Candidatus Micrarchaeota archaeon]
MVKNYLLFVTPTCPSCPPVKTFLKELEQKGQVTGEQVDVTNDNGYERAINFNISKAPTVVFFDENQQEIGRANNVNEIKSIIYDY